MNEVPGARFRAAYSGIKIAEHFRDVEKKDVLLFVDNIFRFVQAGAEISSLLERLPSAVGYQPTLTYEMGAFQDRIGSTRDGSITSIQAVYIPADDLTDPSAVASFSHFDSTIILDRDIAAQGRFPAVNPLESTSKLLARGYVTDEHYETAQKVLTTLEQFNQLQDVIMILGLNGLTDKDKQTVASARRIQNFLTQPFSVAEKFSGMPGKTVPLHETVKSFSELATGKLNHIPEKLFLYKGTIDEVIAEYDDYLKSKKEEEKDKVDIAIDKAKNSKKVKKAHDKELSKKQKAEQKALEKKKAGLEKTTIIDLKGIKKGSKKEKMILKKAKAEAKAKDKKDKIDAKNARSEVDNIADDADVSREDSDTNSSNQ